MGPSILFDKSAIQSLTVDESVWLDQFYLAVISPVFFVETMADLRKSVRHGRSPESEVRIIADKTPCKSAMINVFHIELMNAELNGFDITMDQRPVVPGARPAETERGIEVHFEPQPELEAFNRWREEAFHEVEKITAENWRRHLLQLDVQSVAHQVAIALNPVGVKSYQDAIDLVDAYLGNPKNAVHICGLVESLFGPFNCQHESWFGYFKNQKNAVFGNVFPYCKHVLRVQLFYYVSTLASLESIDKRTNVVDLSYLYYSPFASIFVSDDKIHRRLSPFILQESQTFIEAKDLKADLAIMNDHFSSFPEEEKRMGLYKFATKPPLDESLLTYKMWDKYWFGWRKGQFRSYSKEEMEKMEKEMENFNPGSSIQDPARIQLKRNLERRRGSWTILPDDIG